MEFCVIDVSNLVHRVKHAVLRVQGEMVYNPQEDEEVNQPYEKTMEEKVGIILATVFNSLRKTSEKFKSDHCVVCFDSWSWRNSVYEGYKAHRKKKQEEKTELDKQDDELIKTVLSDLLQFLTTYTNVSVLIGNGIEADDFIARWIQLHDDPSFRHTIVSGDNDFKQLVRDNVNLYNPLDEILYTMDGVFYQDGRKAAKTDIVVNIYDEPWKVKLAKNGQPQTIEPKWELFKKCIRGDISDNIPKAFPNVRETRMREAFNDMGGLIWNNFINDTFGPDDDKKSVRERYELNKRLIDLECQPEEIKDRMDEIVGTQLDREPKRLVAAYFGKFCAKYKLVKINQNAHALIRLLSNPYDC